MSALHLRVNGNLASFDNDSDILFNSKNEHAYRHMTFNIESVERTVYLLPHTLYHGVRGSSIKIVTPCFAQVELYVAHCVNSSNGFVVSRRPILCMDAVLIEKCSK